jgi:N-acyl homoserine lactone hydrolase
VLSNRALPLLCLLPLLTLVACGGTLPSAPVHANVAPQIHSPALDVCWVEYANDTTPGGYGLAGTSDQEHWEITFSGLLVRHPSGDLLLDAGNSSHFQEEVSSSNFFPGLLQKTFQGGGKLVATAPEALRHVGEEPSALQAIALSHFHGDHAGGLVDLPKTPVLLAPQEIAFIASEKDHGGFDVLRAHAQAAEGRMKPIAFTRTPYENFDESADYYGDGSVVFVPLFGHTPGSIGTFVNRSPSERFFHVGDAVNTLEAVEKRRSKSVTLGITDHDAAMADAAAATIGQLHAQAPDVKIIPAHDRKAWIAVFGAAGTCLGKRR